MFWVLKSFILNAEIFVIPSSKLESSEGLVIVKDPDPQRLLQIIWCENASKHCDEFWSVIITTV